MDKSLKQFAFPVLDTSAANQDDGDDGEGRPASSTAFSPVRTSQTATLPPAQPSNTSLRRGSLPFLRSRNRTASGSSMTYLPPAPIILIDHTSDPSERSSAAFARSVFVGDYTIVSGFPFTAGAYVVWNCVVETLEGQKFTVIKRYSEFDGLREKLVQAFPKSKAALPSLPRKSVISRFRSKFLEQRRQGLNYFLSCILLNPEFAGSPLVKEFLFNVNRD